MRFARFIRQVDVGLLLAIPLVAISPLGAVAQNGNMRNSPQYGSPQMSSPVRVQDRPGAPPEREALLQGGSFRWPKMPFSRSNTEKKTTNTTQLPQSGRGTAGTMPLPQQYRNQQSISSSGHSRSAVAQNQLNNRATRSPIARPVTTPAIRQATPPIQATHRPMPPIATPRVAQSMPAARPVGTAEPQSPAAGILAQAHEWSLSAQTAADYTRIIEACEHAHDNNPTPEIAKYADRLASWALNRRGQLSAENGDDAEAIQDFAASVGADADRWRAIHNRGVLEAQAGNFEQAFNDFTRTIELNPNFAKAYSNRAALFVVAGNVEAAIQDYQGALRIDSELAVAHRGLGRAYHLTGDLDAALRSYDEAVRLAPKDAYAIAARADVLTDQGHYANAASEYDRALTIDAHSSHAYCGSAWLLATCPDDSVRDPELAVERAQVAVELGGDGNAASLDTLAAAQAAAGDFNLAARTARQAIEFASESEKPAFEERLALYQQGQDFRIQPSELTLVSHEEEAAK